MRLLNRVRRFRALRLYQETSPHYFHRLQVRGNFASFVLDLLQLHGFFSGRVAPLGAGILAILLVTVDEKVASLLREYGKSLLLER